MKKKKQLGKRMPKEPTIVVSIRFSIRTIYLLIELFRLFL